MPFPYHYGLLLAGLVAGCSRPLPTASRNRSRPAVLVFFKTKGYHHASIPAGIAAFQQLGRENNLRVDTTQQATYFVADSLRRYAAVVFLNTTGDVLDAAQQEAFERYIGQGHGFVGVHAATDTEYDWPWYGGLVGAYFKSHPKVQPATVRVVDAKHPATSFLPAAWQRTDEWYNFRQLAPDLRVLAVVDETTYTGGLDGKQHPFAWCHPYGGGRAFYTAGGHLDENYADPLFRRHLLGGLQYAMGK
ncbi:ThuA domain-containing protein [Hymenobacter coccineus]|uniref:ThuA domain-containing protein n=1 Tax=Hymenobacter coccineus TaxID=1908235 RepID=UPI0009F4BC28|nr:ThuA domain-containing protein [Hymenobacter coccineus]